MDFGTLTLKPASDARNEPLLGKLQHALRTHDTLPYRRDRVGFQKRPDFDPVPSLVTAASHDSIMSIVGGLPTDTLDYVAVALIDEGESRGEIYVCRSGTPWRRCAHYSGESGQYGNDVRERVEQEYGFPPNTTKTVKQLDDFGDSEDGDNDIDGWLGG